MKIQTIKLKKSEYSDVPALLERAGLVKGNQAYTSNLFVSKKTYARIKKELTKAFKKDYPIATIKKCAYWANCDLLNLGPVVIDKGIETGYAVVVPLELEITKLKEENEKLKKSREGLKEFRGGK